MILMFVSSFWLIATKGGSYLILLFLYYCVFVTVRAGPRINTCSYSNTLFIFNLREKEKFVQYYIMYNHNG